MSRLDARGFLGRKQAVYPPRGCGEAPCAWAMRGSKPLETTGLTFLKRLSRFSGPVAPPGFGSALRAHDLDRDQMPRPASAAFEPPVQTFCRNNPYPILQDVDSTPHLFNSSFNRTRALSTIVKPATSRIIEKKKRY